jgi:uncharacterized protein YbjT (DUF2867 family)
MKIFLTGGSGYIGRATITELVRRGHPVEALARSERAERAVVAVGAEAIELDWVRQLGIVGTPRDCAAAIGELARAGADRIILLPLPGDELVQLRAFVTDVWPLL